ncbi:MAG: 2-dehydropantoate 2-reductase [candidate division KSB1 bacterium]
MKENTEHKRPRIAVLGAGSVGCYFGGMLARAGVPVTLIGRAPLVAAITQNGLFLDSINFQQRITAAASTEIEAVREADFVLLCVKTLDTESAARALAPHLPSHAVVVSLQNGVDNVARIRAATGLEAMPAVVYVAAEMIAPGHVKHTGRGDLIIGALENSEPRLDEVAALFVRAGVPCLVSKNIAADLWTKLIINCAYNAISALARGARYGRMVRHDLTRELMTATVKEALAVAHAEGVSFSNMDLIAVSLKLAEKMENATSSTAQDLARGKRTEIEVLNGYIVRRGAALGVPTPVNQTLYALVKLVEEGIA